MARRPSTVFGEPLSDESRQLVHEVRRALTQPRHPNFDTDFNVYRFVACAERVHRARADVVREAARALDTHLRVRHCMRLDELDAEAPIEENRLFRERLMPLGKVLPAERGTDAHNRLLWFVEYATMSIEKIAHAIRSSESVRCQIWQFEHMLRLVNKQEQRTGRLSAIRHVVDMTGYALNPFSSRFVYSGTLSYYSQLFHYDNYPELIYPIELVNIARWAHLPYRMIKGMMPAGFTDRFRLHDSHFLQTLAAEIPLDCIPATLGGQDAQARCIPAAPLAHAWVPPQARLLRRLHPLSVGARRAKCFRVRMPNDGRKRTLSWYFRTDGDIYFGVFYEPNNNDDGAENAENNFRARNGSVSSEINGVSATNGYRNKHGKGSNGSIPDDIKDHHHHHQTPADHMEWVYPWFKLSAKYHHEWDCVDCTRPGTYLVLFSNKHSWLHRRAVDVCIQLEEEESVAESAAENCSRKIRHIVPEQYTEDEEEKEDEEDAKISLRACLQMQPAAAAD